MELREKTFDELVREYFRDDYSEERRETVLEQCRANGATHIVMFINVQLDSSQLGNATLMTVGGPDSSYKLEDLDGDAHLNDLPSQRQYARSFAVVPS